MVRRKKRPCLNNFDGDALPYAPAWNTSGEKAPAGSAPTHPLSTREGMIVNTEKQKLLGYLSTPSTVYQVDSDTPLLLTDGTVLTVGRYSGDCLLFHVSCGDSSVQASGDQFLVQAGANNGFLARLKNC